MQQMKKSKIIFFLILQILSVALLFLSCSSTKTTRLDAYGCYRAGQYEETIKVAKEDLKLGNSPRDNYCLICWSQLQLARYEEAESTATEGLRLYPFAEYLDYRLVQCLDDAKNHRPRTDWTKDYQDESEYIKSPTFRAAASGYVEYMGLQENVDDLINRYYSAYNEWQ